MAHDAIPEVEITPVTETSHAGRVITVVRKFRPAYDHDYTNSYSGVTTTHHSDAWEIWEASIDGKAWYGLASSKSPQDATNRAKRAIDRQDADEAIYGSLQTYVGRVDVALGKAERGEDGKLHKPVIATNVTPAGVVKLGDRVVAYSRGYWRRALISKVGRKNVEIAYVTSVGGTLTRKSVAASDVYREVVA
jgi:hypothetical protein